MTHARLTKRRNDHAQDRTPLFPGLRTAARRIRPRRRPLDLLRQHALHGARRQPRRRLRRHAPTQGYAYLLYQQGVYDKTTNTLFANAAVPGATSSDVLAYQVPQAITRFQPGVLTLSVGGNDLLRILNKEDPSTVIREFQVNLADILCTLHRALPQSRIYLHNLYDVPEITAQVTGGLQAILAFNDVIAGVAKACGASVADVYTAFSGRTGLLLIERNGAGQFEVHPTNAGYRAIANAFKEVHQ